jgi:lysophospholipase
MILNGYNVATQANSTREGASDWPTCVACAVLSRSMERNGEQTPEACQKCFSQYCWDGSVPTTSEPYFPEMIDAAAAQANKDKKSEGGKIGSSMGLIVAAAVAGFMAM